MGDPLVRRRGHGGSTAAAMATVSACSTPITPSSPRWAPQDCSSAD